MGAFGGLEAEAIADASPKRMTLAEIRTESLTIDLGEMTIADDPDIKREKATLVPVPET